MKIICIGRNYADHAKELNNPIPEEPLIFMKPPSALLVNHKPFYYPDFSNDIHFEGELVLKIGKNGRHVQKEFASGYYPEIGFGFDLTARDIQNRCKQKGHPWEIAKGFDHAAPISKTFIPITELNRTNIEFIVEKNGTVVQHGFTQDMLFPFDEIIMHVSKYFKLQMGDLIFTGTPAGVGPIQPGDQLDGYIVDQAGQKRHMLNCEVR